MMNTLQKSLFPDFYFPDSKALKQDVQIFLVACVRHSALVILS